MCLKKIQKYLNKRKEKNFWNHADSWLAAIVLKDDQVYGRIRENLALLNGIPKPQTGYFYRDIVYVEGPTGMQLYRDDEIEEYLATGIYKRSNIPTFTFKAVIPSGRDYFHLQDMFRGEIYRVRFPWSEKENNHEWRLGYCTAKSIEDANRLLTKFGEMHAGTKVKDISTI